MAALAACTGCGGPLGVNARDGRCPGCWGAATPPANRDGTDAQRVVLHELLKTHKRVMRP